MDTNPWLAMKQKKNPLYSVNPQTSNAYELKYFLIDYQL